MTLKQYFQKFSFDEIYEELDLMYEFAAQHKEYFRHAYEILLELQPIATKKTIRYQVFDDPEMEESYSGAADHCFNTTWEVCLAKEVQVDEDCDLTDLELTTNALLCLVFMARCPRAFLPEKRILNPTL